MPYCPSCGNEVTEKHEYCFQCGTRLTKDVPQEGIGEKGARFKSYHEDKKWLKKRYALHFTNERKIPGKLLELLNYPDLPQDLRDAITKAKEELKTQGAVTYPTISKIDYFLHYPSDNSKEK